MISLLWSAALSSRDLKEYVYFIFINSSSRGPFLPIWNKENWVNHLTGMITTEVKLAGPTVGYYATEKDNIYVPHVQSMVFVTDHVGLNIAFQKNILGPTLPQLSHEQTSIQCEVAFSSYILDAGYNIACLLAAYRNVDFRTLKERDGMKLQPRPTNYGQFPSSIRANHHWGKDYYSMSPHPYEILFIKTSSWAAPNYLVLMNYCSWTRGHPYSEDLQGTSNNSTIEVPPDFDWRMYLYINKDVARVGCSQDFAVKHWINHGRKEGRIYKIDRNFDEIFNASAYMASHPQIKVVNAAIIEKKAVYTK